MPTIRTSSSPRTRARRRSPTTRTASARNTASGSATRSRPAARRATTTRRWASPRAARGNRSSATSARWASTRRRPTSRSRASATCRATCSATACCCRGTSGSSRRSTTATSSSIPTPTRQTSFAERERLFKLPRSSWADYDAKLISTGGGVYPRSAKSIADHAARCKARSAIDADALTPTELVERDPQGAGRPALQRRHRHLREGERPKRTRKSAIAPTTRCASTARELRCKVVGEGGNLGCTQLGPHRVRARGRAHLHRRDRQLGRRRHVRPRGQHQDPARPRRSPTAS